MTEVSISAALISHVPHTMTEAMATSFKTGERTIIRSGHVAGVIGDIDERQMNIQHRAHVLGVMLPVGSQSQYAAVFEYECQQVCKCRLDQASFVMSRLVPRIGKENVYGINAGRNKLVREYFHGIMAASAHIADAMLLNLQQQMPGPGAMYFNAEAIHSRVGLRIRTQSFTCAETDLDHAWGMATEYLIQIQ